MTRGFVSVIMLFMSVSATGQTLKISGDIRNLHGEPLPSAQIFVTPDSATVITDNEGRFSVTTVSGRKIFAISYVGYERQVLSFVLTRDTTLRLLLEEQLNELQAVEIEGLRNGQENLFRSNQTSTNIIDKDDITSIPVLGGEADVIKTLQLLPGTIKGVEGSSDLFVRGGAADQNLVLLDGAPIYNTSHLFGFLSVFNPDILDQVEAINGGFPARYGGRLSSILNVNTTSTVPDKTHLSGDIGLIASRMMIEQPLVRNKASFWVAARRTYIDKVVAALGEELPYFFYDLNAKVILHPDPANQIEVGYYGGNDVLDWFRDRNNDGDGFLTTFESGNNSQTLKWSRRLPEGWKGELNLIRSAYQYDIRNLFEDNKLIAKSDIEDYGGKLTLSKDSLPGESAFMGGVELTRHSISPNVISTAGFFSEVLPSSSTSGKVATEASVFGEYTRGIVEQLSVNVGLRVSGGFVQGRNFINPEPRLSLRYALAEHQALKLGYSRMAQYIHRISNSAVATPADIWYPVTKTITPQTSHQIALAWQKTIPDKKYFFSIEAYAKEMSKLIGYLEGTNLFFNTDFESRLVQGRGRAYGIEYLLRKDAGRLTGWISYTLSWSWRKFDVMNDGNWFPSRYDRRHNGAIVMQYGFTKRFSASLVWEFISGSRFTPIIGQYFMLAPTLSGADLIPVYSDLNGIKLADTHRLDVGLKFKSRPGRKFQWHWFAGVYNAYNRAAPVGINIRQDETSGALSYEQPGLFGLLPFISYGFTL